jgi:hypothetical protein
MGERMWAKKTRDTALRVLAVRLLSGAATFAQSASTSTSGLSACTPRRAGGCPRRAA